MTVSDEQKAINEWFKQNENKCDPTTLGDTDEFLRNRLWRALVDGISIGRELHKQDVIKVISKLI